MKNTYKLEYVWLLLSVLAIAACGIDEIRRHAQFPQSVPGAVLLFCGTVILTNLLVLGAYSLHITYKAFRKTK